MGDSISEGVIESFVAPIGKLVKADDVIARIETDKVTVDILAKFDGVITKYYAAEGDTVAVGANFCDIDPSGTPSSGSATPAAPKKEAPKVVEPVKAEPAKSTPVPEKSVPAAVAPQATPVASSSPNMTTVTSKKAPSEITGSRLETRVAMNKMRQTISRRLKESQNTNASLTTFNEIDMSAIMDART